MVKYTITTHDLVKIQPSATANPATDPQHKGPQSLELDAFKGIIDKLIEMGLLPSDDPPTQVLVNEYVGCCGIANHFDDSLAFGDAIVTISLEKPVWLLLSNSEESTKVLLEKNSLFVMKEDARYKYKHGISKAAWVRLPDCRCEKRDSSYVRVSLTIRKLVDGRKKVEKDFKDWDECLLKRNKTESCVRNWIYHRVKSQSVDNHINLHETGLLGPTTKY